MVSNSGTSDRGILKGGLMRQERLPAYRDKYCGKYGPISKRKLAALVHVRAIALDAIRSSFRAAGATEVTTATLVNVAGSCENPYASFPLQFYGGEVFLTQS